MVERATSLRSYRVVAAGVLVVTLLASACDGSGAGNGATTVDGSTPPTTAPPIDPSTTTGALDPSTTTNAPGDDGVWMGPPQLRDVSDYAAGLGITVEEARRRNGLVEALSSSELGQWLDRHPTLVWVEETADDWQLVIGRTGVPAAFIERTENRVAGTPLEGLIEVRRVDHDFDDLRRTEERMLRAIAEWCLPPPTRISVDYRRNLLTVGVQSLVAFAAAAEAAGIGTSSSAIVLEEYPMEVAPAANTERCDAPLRALAAARNVWTANQLDRYAYKVTAWSTWYGSVDVGEILVWDGEVTRLLPPDLEPDSPFYPARFDEQYGTVERLFDIVESHPVQWVQVTYDRDWGFPARLGFDQPQSIDEEHGFRIDGFRVLDTPPPLVPPRESRRRDDLLELEAFLRDETAVVEGVIGPAVGIDQLHDGWRHTLEITSVLSADATMTPSGGSTIEVVDRAGIWAPRALLHRAGNSTRLLLAPGDEGRWLVLAVLDFTPNGLRMESSFSPGLSEELGYLCHYPRSDIPTDPPPQRDAEAEFDVLLRWLEERGPVDPEDDRRLVNARALRRVCDEL